MESQQIIVMLAAVLILQLITILIITGKKKQGRGSVETRRPNAEFRSEKKDSDPRRGNTGNKKPGENRIGGNRPQQQNKPPQSQPSGAIDPMEKSLRDINLRLKNAEREQENARKKFQEGGSGSGNAGSGRDNRESRPPHQRGERGNRSGGGHRDFNRDQRRDNRPEKPYRAEQENTGFSAPATVTATESEQPVIAPTTPDFAVNDTGVSEDQLQHGRKFTAKRRQLPSDIAPETETGIPETSAPEAAAAPQVTESAPAVQVEQQTDGSDIQFGRR